MTLDQAEKITKVVTPWVALFSLIATVTIATCTYQQTLTRDATSRVLEFAKDYRTGLLKDQVLLSEKMRVVYATQVIPRYAVPTLSSAEKIRIKDDATRTFISNGEAAANSFVGILIFYINVSSCVSAGICDCKVAHTMFKTDATAFRRSMFPVLDARKKETGDSSLDLLDAFVYGACA